MQRGHIRTRWLREAARLLLCLGPVGALWLAWPKSSNGPPEVGNAAAIRVRAQPRAVDVFPLDALEIDRNQLEVAVRSVRPRFGSYKLPLMVIYHALRVWGPDAPFGDTGVAADSEGSLRGRGLFLEILTDTAAYRRYSKFTLDRLLAPSPYGVQVISTSDAGWGRQWGSTHIGKYLQVMGELGVPSERPLALDEGRRARLADVVRDEAARVREAVELEWVTIGLGFYLDAAEWQNQDGRPVSFADLAVWLAAKPPGQGACKGTHVCYALASLLSFQRRDKLLNSATEAAVRSRLREYGALLTRSQAADGSWGNDWAEDSTQRARKTPGPDLPTDRITATGHHLEWMLIAEPALRPKPDVLKRAATYLARSAPSYRRLIEEDFHAYLPISHAVRAMILATGQRWGDEALVKGH